MLVLIQNEDAHIVLGGQLIGENLHFFVVQIAQHGVCCGDHPLGLEVAIKVIQTNDLEQPKHGNDKPNKEQQVQHDAAADAEPG